MSCKIGQTCYYEILAGIIIPVEIIEIVKCYGITAEKMKEYNLVNPSVWEYNKYDGSKIYVGTKNTTNENPWGFKEIDDGVIKGSNYGYEGIWINEYVGYALTIGDDIFETLDEAMNNINVAPRRNRNRANKKINSFRKKTYDWLNMNHIDCGAEPLLPFNPVEKKI